MPTYKVWYNKTIKANNIKEAIKKEARVKNEFHSIEEVKEEHGDLEHCIGFEIYDEDEELNNEV